MHTFIRKWLKFVTQEDERMTPKISFRNISRTVSNFKHWLNNLSLYLYKFYVHEWQCSCNLTKNDTFWNVKVSEFIIKINNVRRPMQQVFLVESFVHQRIDCEHFSGVWGCNKRVKRPRILTDLATKSLKEMDTKHRCDYILRDKKWLICLP